MKCAGITLLLACTIALGLVQSSLAQEDIADGPKNEKAQKTYKEALEDLHHRYKESALEKFRKADKQDNGHCLACQQEMIKYGVELQDWNTAEAAAEEMAAQAKGDRETAIAHYNLGLVLIDEGLIRHKDELFSHSHDEMTKALAAVPKFPQAIFADGRALAHLKQDDAAKARFEEFVKMRPESDPDRRRAQRYIDEPELARARMAPAFAVTTTDGQQIAMDDLVGKVVLLDFWATWCAPCREALPHMREIAKRFQGQPLVVFSISLDKDEQKWKNFIAKNEMIWPQYRDGGFTGAIAKKFGVTAIPHTFTIDADSVLQDEHIGDASIEGKLKKLIGRAREAQAAVNAQ
jgi:thiol-disulfide isomerase/thioredoxin